MRAAEACTASMTARWSTGASVVPAAGLLTSATPATRTPAARTAIVSSTVDIPTRSAPRVASMRISAGVSKCGPGSPAYTPSASSGSIPRARARSPGS